MQRYVGTKIINAKPMNRLEYNEFRGWTLPADENGSDEGYLVEYVDGGKPNTTQYAGYVSWSPKEQFDNAYRETVGISFGDAVEALKIGKKVARAGWNGKGMFLVLIPSCSWDYAAGLTDNNAENPCVPALLPWIGMKTADNKLVPWLASQTDVLADDWSVID